MVILAFIVLELEPIKLSLPQSLAMPRVPKARSSGSSYLRSDHMHRVVELGLHGPLETSTKFWEMGQEKKNVRGLSPIKSWHCKSSTPQTSKNAIEQNISRITPSNKSKARESGNSNSKFIVPPVLDMLARPLPLKEASSKSNMLSPSAVPRRKVGIRRDVKFPFMQLPPELRNSVYHILLTTPSAPIELPRITRDIATRTREWVKCKDSSSKRARFKSLFLEILQTCKQVHDEGSSILYGCNVFKFRNCHSEGPKTAVLPTRHLRLLKNIKVSVISREPYNGQDKRVADLLKTFVHEEMQLETFELSWYGWKRYHLGSDGLVCQALKLLQAEKQFIVKVLGEARMVQATEQQLQQNIHSRKVEIHRPVNAITGAELSDRE